VYRTVPPAWACVNCNCIAASKVLGSSTMAGLTDVLPRESPDSSPTSTVTTRMRVRREFAVFTELTIVVRPFIFLISRRQSSSRSVAPVFAGVVSSP
jgi:hypothetical protein